MPEPTAHLTSDGLHLTLLAAGPELLVRAEGELDVAAAPLVTEAADAAQRAGCRRLIIEASQLTFADAAGVRCLVAPAPARTVSLEVRLRNPSRPVQRVLALTGHLWLIDGDASATPSASSLGAVPAPPWSLPPRGAHDV